MTQRKEKMSETSAMKSPTDRRGEPLFDASGMLRRPDESASSKPVKHPAPQPRRAAAE